MLDDSGPTARATRRVIFDMHFAGLCWTPEAMPFDLLCNHIPREQRDDPSPWPDVFLALKGMDIVAVIVSDAAWVPRTWRCWTRPDVAGPRMCTAPGVERDAQRLGLALEPAPAVGRLIRPRVRRSKRSGRSHPGAGWRRSPAAKSAVGRRFRD